MLRLRPYSTKDSEEILSWCTDELTFYKWSAGLLGEYPLTEEKFSTINKLMAFTAVEDNEVIGFFTMRTPDNSVDELRFGFIIVNPQKRKMGYGNKMLSLGLKYAKEIYGVKKVSLGVFENNPGAYSCYKSVGFDESKTKLPKKYHILNEEWNCLELEILF